MNFMVWMLFLLLGLNLLMKLNLSDCNFCEGDILCDIFGLFFLMSFDFSGNNFISMFVFFILLLKFEFFMLLNCNMCIFGEVDIYIDIFGLFFLMYFYFSGNNFIIIFLVFI